MVELHVEPAALTCAVGHELDASVAAIRSGIAALDEIPFRNDDNRPITGAAIPGFGELPAAQRITELLCCAIAEVGRRFGAMTIGRCIVVCSDAPTRRIRGDVGQLLRERSGVRIDSLELECGDETTCVRVLSRLRNELEHGDEPVLVCAVDSLIDTPTMAQASLRGRLRTETNADGFAPGEAAACVWVRTTPSPTASRVAGLGLAIEPATILDELPHEALGMTQAARDALAEAGWRYADLNLWIADLGGEHYEFNELALCCARLPTERCEGVDIWHPAESFASVGVVGAPAGWILATRASHDGGSPGRKVVCSAAAATGGRAIVLLETPAAAVVAEEDLEAAPRWAW